MYPRSRSTRHGVVLMLFLAAAAAAQSSRPGWGATPYADPGSTGVTFRVWAPNATSVTVPGQFNGWSQTATPLSKEQPDGVWNGVWSADVPIARAGHEYKYFLNASIWKRDPRGRKVVSSGGNSIVYDPVAFNWGTDNPAAPALEDLFIYELHIGTFYDPTPADSLPGRFTDAIAKLDYLKALGINAVEVMPIAEFPGNNSWGYNPADPYAVENIGYGGPDGFKTFVKACHARGLAVLLDIIHNHYGPSDLDLWNFDGWTGGGNGGGIYFYQDARCCTPYGSRPDYGRQPVRDYIQDNFRMWLDEYRVDGFRWDTPGLMMNSDAGFIIDAATLITAINNMIHTGYAGKISIAEDEINYGFDSGWDTTYPWTLTPQLADIVDSGRDMNVVANAVTYNTRFQVPASLNRTVFLESHDVVGDLNSGKRLVTAIDATTPDSYWARKRSTLGAAVTFTSPGVPMLFQGQEMLESRQFSSSLPVDWSKTITYTNIVRLYRDLVWLRRNLFGITPGLKGQQCSLLRVDHANKLVAYRRWKSGSDTQDAVVVANFANAVRSNYQLPFPRAGDWYVHFNSDFRLYSGDYGDVGSVKVTAGGAPVTANITIGPYSALILSQSPPPALSMTHSNGLVALYWPISYAGWVLESTPSFDGSQAVWSTIAAGQYRTNSSSFLYTVPPTERSFYRLRRN